jgi:hypothetical protein
MNVVKDMDGCVISPLPVIVLMATVPPILKFYNGLDEAQIKHILETMGFDSQD